MSKNWTLQSSTQLGEVLKDGYLRYLRAWCLAEVVSVEISVLRPLIISVLGPLIPYIPEAGRGGRWRVKCGKNVREQITDLHTYIRQGFDPWARTELRRIKEIAN